MRPKWQGIALVAVCGAIWLATGIGCGPGKQAKKTYTRDELRAAVVGKTKDEVVSLIGKPDRTEEPHKGNYWSYWGVNIDPATGKRDASAYLYFDAEGRVKKVEF